MISSFIEYISTTLNTDVAAVKLLFSLLVGYPIGILYSLAVCKLPVSVQHVYFLLLGITLYFWNFGWSIMHSLMAILTMFFVLHTIGRTKWSVVFGFVFNTTHLMYGYYMKNYGTYDINWTMPHCVLTLRLIGLAWDIYDGGKREESLSDSQKQSALKTNPNLLEILGFCYYPTAFLVGPQFSMRRYQSQLAETAKFTAGNQESARLLEWNWAKIRRSADRLLIGFIYLAIFLFGSSYVPVEFMLTDQFLTDWSFIQRLAYMALFAKIVLMRYFVVWLICEGACLTTELRVGLTSSCGAGARAGSTAKRAAVGGGAAARSASRDGVEQESYATNVYIRRFELSTNCDALVSSFNINTNKWMLEYMYKRLRFLGNRHLSHIVTLMYLALWHGIYTGYFVNFFLEFLTVASEKDFLGLVSKSSLNGPLTKTRVGRILSSVLGKLHLAFCLSQPLPAFCLLRFSLWFKVYRSMYFVGLIYLLYPLIRPILLLCLPPEKPRQAGPQQGSTEASPPGASDGAVKLD